MTDFFEKLPGFWQGVVSSFIAGISLLILGVLLRIFLKQFRESSRIRKARVEELRQQLVSDNASERMEASMQFTFKTLYYLFLGNILWVAPEAVGVALPFRPLYLLKSISLVMFWFGLRWIYHYFSAKATILPELQIIQASYGSVQKLDDVTEELRHNVIDNTLTIKAGNTIAGNDPHPGVVKILMVRYLFDGKEHEKKFREMEIVALP